MGGIAASDWFSNPERLREAFAGVIGVESDGVALIGDGILTRAARRGEV